MVQDGGRRDEGVFLSSVKGQRGLSHENATTLLKEKDNKGILSRTEVEEKEACCRFRRE